ncbi:MAG: hypothetical protein KAS49_01385 [Candidatus Cloacimonetes bacterium]|nr:hypothetical protein [Candidatus Cloacimonadota bacterium]
MKKIIIITIILMSLSALWSQPNFHKAFGLSYGMATGNGFSYRQINNDYGFQATGAIALTDEESIIFTGTQFIKPLHSISKTRFNMTIGLGTMNHFNSNKYDESFLYFGAGPEVEVTFSYNIRLIIGTPYTIFKQSSNSHIMGTFMPTFSIMYYFD